MSNRLSPHDEPRTRETQLFLVRVEWFCPTDGCNGLMEQTGQYFTTAPTRESYEHKCTVCHREAWAKQRYPLVEYR